MSLQNIALVSCIGKTSYDITEAPPIAELLFIY